MVPTPTPLPYVFTTPVAELLATVADPSTGVPSFFTADLGVLAAAIIGVMWLAVLLRKLGVHRLG